MTRNSRYECQTLHLSSEKPDKELTATRLDEFITAHAVDGWFLVNDIPMSYTNLGEGSPNRIREALFVFHREIDTDPFNG
jgi:hypothetical protein